MSLRRSWIIFSLAMVLSLDVVGFSSPSGSSEKGARRGSQIAGQNKPSSQLEPLALNAVSRLYGLPIANLEVDNSAIATFEYSGKRANVFSVTDNSTDKAYEIALDDNGLVLDLVKLRAEDAAARAAKYGKLLPYLWDYLQHASPTEQISVTVLLDLGPGTDRPMDEPSLNSEQMKKMSPQELQDYNQKDADFEKRLQAYDAARAQRVVGPVVARLKKAGYDVQVSGNTGFISLKCVPSMIKEMEKWPEVREIFSGPNVKSDARPVGKRPTGALLDVSRPMVGADRVENRGINGQNVTIAQVEQGGRIIPAVGTTNPYLSGASQDNTFICAGNANDHAVAVAGILVSHATPPIPYRGIAPGAHLIATGSCAGTLDQIESSTRSAIGLGAVTLNHSYNQETGNAITNPVAGLDQFMDARVFTDRTTNVVAAGNEAGPCGDGTGNVASPAKAYNVISVGNFNDFESQNWNNAQMDPCSSFFGPSSANGDRIKPEIVAPGTLIDTTLAQEVLGSWFGDHFAVGGGAISGTSFASPHVAGVTALVISRAATTFGLTNFHMKPEVIKAIILASADNSFPGADGIGALSALWADDIMSGNFGGHGHSNLTCADLPQTLATIPLQVGLRTRIVIVWSTDPNYANYFTQPSSDLGLRVRDLSGNLVASADSFDNTYEVVNFTPAVGGNYTIHVRSRRCDESPGMVAYAYWQAH